MLEDEPRNQAYKTAIFKNKDLIKGKVILDVGAGTGILSIFCAQAGASKVYAVEASGLYKITQQVVRENHFQNVIEVIHSRVEDLTNLRNDEKVDVIVSEWMGFYLLHECMLDSVLIARDKFLKEDGHLFPESATIYCAPCSLPSMYDFWSDVEGISMKCVGSHFRSLKSQKPEVLTIREKDLLSEGSPIFWADLRDITAEELQSIYFQNVVASRRNGQYQGVCLWFACQFPTSDDDDYVTLSTSPKDPVTHWRQTAIVLPTDLPVEDGSPIAFELRLLKSGNNDDDRRYNIELTMLDPEEVTHPEPCHCHMTKCILIKKMLEQYERQGNKDLSEYLRCFFFFIPFRE